jgi:hypothetical protein
MIMVDEIQVSFVERTATKWRTATWATTAGRRCSPLLLLLLVLLLLLLLLLLFREGAGTLQRAASRGEGLGPDGAASK